MIGELFCSRKRDGQWKRIYFSRRKHENQDDKNKNLSLKSYLNFFFSSSSELVYQMKESFNAWIINPVNKVVFSSLTETDEYRDIYANWRTNRRYY